MAFLPAEESHSHPRTRHVRYIMDMLHPVLEEMVAETIHKMPKERIKFKVWALGPFLGGRMNNSIVDMFLF